MKDFIRTGVIGHPIGHSKSPLIHNYWIQKYGLNGEYKAIDIPPEALKNVLYDLVAEGYRGFNFTIPHKEAVLKLCDSVDPLAQSIGAVNTVRVERGKLHGTNTDVFGFLMNIAGQYADWSFAGQRCVLLGAGGAARAVLKALLGQQVSSIVILNRTRQSAENCVQWLDDPSVSVRDWEQRSAVLAEADFLVNTTALGMKGQMPLEIDLSALPKTALVHDIVYAPLETPLLRAARARGNRVAGGIGMLLHQARPGFQSWYGVLPAVTPELEILVGR